MKKYLAVIQDVLTNGEWQDNRTGVRTIAVPGAHVRFDMAEGFPALTTRKLAFKSAVGELCGFLRGCTSAADFRALGCKVWDQNANENQAWLKNPARKGEDDLGPVYGAQWRNWPAYRRVPFGVVELRDQMEAQGWEALEEPTGDTYMDSTGSAIYHRKVDQLADCVVKIIQDPGNRRILFHGWNPAELDFVALPACHLLYQFHANATKRELSMSVYIR